MTTSNLLSLCILHSAATFALSLTAVEGVNYMMQTPYESNTCTVTSTFPNHVGPELVAKVLQLNGMTIR